MLPRGHVPDDGVRRVARDREQAAVVAERERDDVAERAAQLAEDGLVAVAPQRHAARRRRGREQPAVGAHRHGRRGVRRRLVAAFAADRDGVEAERPAEASFSEHVPDDLAPVARAGDECRPVGAEERGDGRARVPGEALAQPSGRDVPDADAAVVGARREHLAVAAERQSEHAARRATRRRPDAARTEVEERDGAVVAAERRDVRGRRERCHAADVERAHALRTFARRAGTTPPRRSTRAAGVRRA